MVPPHDTCTNNANTALRDLSLHDGSPFAEHIQNSHRNASSRQLLTGDNIAGGPEAHHSLGHSCTQGNCTQGTAPVQALTEQLQQCESVHLRHRCTEASWLPLQCWQGKLEQRLHKQELALLGQTAE